MAQSTSASTASDSIRSKTRSRSRRGRIGLQFREGPVAFRNIRLKPLGLKPMLNGKDLAGWNTDQTSRASKFEVDDRTASSSVTNGRGKLETEASYGDFVMQLDCFVDGDGLNSGVFFRSIPGDTPTATRARSTTRVKDGDPTQARRLRHRRHLPPHHGPPRRVQGPRVVHQDDRRHRPAHRRVGQRLPGDRLDRRPPAARQPPQRPPHSTPARSASKATTPPPTSASATSASPNCPRAD